LAWDTAQFHDGARSLKLTVSGSPATARIFQNTSNDYPVIGGKAYTVRFWAFDTTTHTNLAAAIEWRDGSHAAISIATGTATAIAATTWEQRTATLIAPLTAQYAAFGPALGASPPNGEVLHIDELEFLETTDQPEVSTNQIQRRKLGENDWVTIAEVPLDGTYQDFHTGSGSTYEYRVVGVASGIGQSISETVEAVLDLLGVWMHDPSLPADTIRNFVYGSNQRGALRAARSQLTYFAGRRDPIADFAEHTDQVFSVTVDVAFGDDWQTKLDELYALEDSRQTLVYRDNRRRMAFGILGGITETDMPWGTQVSFEFTKVHYDEAVA
jgi:hypothetical protein